jgi:hypothetical protein
MALRLDVGSIRIFGGERLAIPLAFDKQKTYLHVAHCIPLGSVPSLEYLFVEGLCWEGRKVCDTTLHVVAVPIGGEMGSLL